VKRLAADGETQIIDRDLLTRRETGTGNMTVSFLKMSA
jgi:hypothetical protein